VEPERGAVGLHQLTGGDRIGSRGPAASREHAREHHM
jgi:hypothetical protein